MRSKTLPKPHDAPLRPPWTRSKVALACLLVAAAVLAPLSLRGAEISPGRLYDGVGDIARLLDRMWPPIFANPGSILELTLETFFIAVAGTTLALVLSVPLAFLAAYNTAPGRVLRVGARGVIVLARAIPDLVFALIFVRALGIGVLPGVLALGLHSIGMLGKLFADAIEEVDRAPMEAAEATGARRIQVLINSVLPQIMPTVIGTTLYRLDINVRLSAVLGLVGAGGIGMALQASIRGLNYRTGLGLVIIIFILIVLIERISTVIRRSIIGLDADREVKSRARASRRKFAASGSDGAPAASGSVEKETRAQGLQGSVGHGQAVSPPWTKTRLLKLTYGIGTAALVMFSFIRLDVGLVSILQGLPSLVGVIVGMFPPTFGGIAPTIMSAMLESLTIGFAATAIGLTLSIPIAFLGATNVTRNRPLNSAVRYLVVGVRGVPEMVLALIFVAALGLGPFAGTIALSIGSIGLSGKLLMDSLEQLPPGPRLSADAVGSSPLQAVFASALPQSVPSLVSVGLYQLDINIRMSVVLGIVGAGGVGFLIVDSVRTLNFDLTLGILSVIFVIVYAIELLAGWIRKQII